MKEDDGDYFSRQNGIRFCHFCKGYSLLCNKLFEVENIVNVHQSHVLTQGESNFVKGQDIDEVQLEYYNFITAKILNNPKLIESVHVSS